MNLELEDDVALVTASSAGLGYGSAESLAEAGANVVVCGRDAEKLATAETALEGVGTGRVVGVEADITDPDSIENLVEVTVDEFGGIDHLVTSAGGVPPGTFDEMTEKEWYGAYDMLVMSVVWTVKTAAPYLKQSEAGTVTCITSTSVQEAIDGLVLSNAVRRGVIGLVKTLAREYAPNVRANAVLPGAHETARIEELVEDSVDRGEYDSYDEGLQSWADDIPLGRVGDPRELGDVVTFLASRRASFVNGVALPVDGGRLRS
ncbi:SDR family oxidoreductase [Halogranum rubrum]|uniref:Short-chain dehydrogenase/reductase SDR n=1 Tax=Halogranum salarium B-1 TaxID=1210908 RepID=J3EXD6_9EURY|nr:SDR family oxidoreductase [Halogranum salarium]EJN59732.1 short-chain dehydrogenase/reductase SDR [Halogranum salarium B-1]